MELRFKTNSLLKARRVALPLIQLRSNSHQPLMPVDVGAWVEQRFPNLSEQDRSSLKTECELACAGDIDG
jgi:hypothetical protein